MYDTECSLAKLLSDTYQQEIKSHQHKAINFPTVAESVVEEAVASLPEHSLVILVQSLSFRMTKHRLRADLFRAGHMVIEHARLSRNNDDEIQNYIDSLRYDTPYYVQATTAMEKLLQENTKLRIESGHDLILEIDSRLEKPLKNTGDFSDNPIVAAGFPIGEIFTEAKELDKMNGSVLVFGFPTLEHKTYFCAPFEVQIKDGCVVSHNGPPLFAEILQLIASEEVNAAVQVREIGFGLNRGLGFTKTLHEPTAFERFAGMHFSLGLKHAMYAKKLGKKVYQKYHIDIFCKVKNVFIGDTQVMKEGEYVF
jgi:leucyl aminopeptidase (aminopeptidase T)